MVDSLYETCLQGIMVAVFFKMKHPVQDDEYIDRDSLHAGVVEGIGHCAVS